MIARVPPLSLNQRLAATAFVLGLAALFAHPQRGPVVSLDERELAALVGREADHVTATELANWIIRGRSDYRLLDLREEKDFAAYHIPTAESAPLPSLPDRGLPRNETIVLYSEGGIHAAQAWILLRAGGYKAVYTLLGGLEAWKDDVLFPSLAEGATPEQKARFEAAAAVSRFFGGSPRAGAADLAAAKPPELPRIEAPVGQAGATPAPARKKRKEGC
jgi:rhodanese-related sulfurtransferase